MINIHRIVESFNTALDLEMLYTINRNEFIKQVKPRIRFSYSVDGISYGNYIMRYNSDYSLIEANPVDVIKHTIASQQVKPYYQSQENHISVGIEVSSREFRAAAHALSNGYLDAPEIYVNSSGALSFCDGRHRTALAADCGIKLMPFVISNDGLNNLARKKLFNYKLNISGG